MTSGTVAPLTRASAGGAKLGRAWPSGLTRHVGSAGRDLYVPALLMGLCLAAQLYLLLTKSFNWDEFLHFSQVYQARSGTLSQPLQVFLSRILWWAPQVSPDLLVQMRWARLFSWTAHLVTLAMIYGIARQFTGAGNAFFAAFAYLGAGYVFSHGFSIRADPTVTATLMSALFLLARGRLGWGKSVAIGALLGLAGMLTVKSMFYAPCFAGLLWLQSRQAPPPARLLPKLAVLAAAALLTFAALYAFHTASIDSAAPLRTTSTVSNLSRWITFGMPFAGYTLVAIVLAPLFFLGVALAPGAWRKARLPKEVRVALAGFVAPLIVLFFYRNTFPYFFVFLLAPVAVGIAPALGIIRDRVGNIPLALMLAAVPLAVTVMEPREVLARQKAMIDYVHREYPAGTPYLDYAGMIADYPRILKHLTSGNGIRGYHERGDPIIGRAIDSGRLPFIIANYPLISEALEGRPVPNSFLPADLAAMTGHYVHHWGGLWREGELIPAGTVTHEFELRRGGRFVLSGQGVTIDGTPVAHGQVITLSKGRHTAAADRTAPSVLWRGSRLPAAPPAVTAGDLFTRF